MKTLHGSFLMRGVALAVLAVLLVDTVHSTAIAATQGTLGPTSTGSLILTVKKTALAKITNLTDLTLNNWQDGDGDVLLTNDVCVYSTRPSGGYTVRATGSGAAGAFTLASGNSSLPYNISWNAGGVGNLSNTGITLTPNTTSPGLTKAATDNANCAGTKPGPTARLMVGIPAATMASASDGSFTGTLTLMISPN